MAAMESASYRGLSAPGADCNFAIPKSREMPDAPFITPVFAVLPPFCRYYPNFCRPLLMGGPPPSVPFLRHCMHSSLVPMWPVYMYVCHMECRRGPATRFLVIMAFQRLDGCDSDLWLFQKTFVPSQRSIVSQMSAATTTNWPRPVRSCTTPITPIRL